MYSSNRMLNFNLKKRERTLNWSAEEKEVLFELVEKDVKIVESKTASPTEKAKVWKKIYEKFNEILPTQRDQTRVREQWRRMKAYAKLEMRGYIQKAKSIGWSEAENYQPSDLTIKIWRLCLEIKSSDNAECGNVDESENTENSLNFLDGIDCYTHLENSTTNNDLPSVDGSIAVPQIKTEKTDIVLSDEENENENYDSNSNNSESIREYDLSVPSKRRKFDLTGRVNGDIIKDNGISNFIPVTAISTPLCKDISQSMQNNSNPFLQQSQGEWNLKMQILNTELECARIKRETALNDLKASEAKRQMIEFEASEKFKSQVKMIGERGAGAGKGGGGGGSIREAGGSFGKMEAAHEDQYFYNMQKEQISKLREGLHDEISFHEEQIKRHQEAINRHKKRITEMEKQ